MKLNKNLVRIPPYVPGVYKKGAIKLASNENPVGPSPKALNSIMANADLLNVYPDSACLLLRQAIAEKHGLGPEQIIVGNGSDEVMAFAAAAYIKEGLSAVTSKATFSTYSFVTKLYGGKMKLAAMKNGRFQLDRIASLCDSNTSIVFLCNPNSPTGTYFTQEEFEEFLSKVSNRTLVVLDEAYIHYAVAQDMPDSLGLMKDHGNIMVLRTLSKIYGLAGLRIGYGIASNKVVADLEKTRLPFNVNALSQIAGVQAMLDDGFVRKMVEINVNGKEYLYQQFDLLKLEYYKTQANFIFVDLKRDCMDAFKKLMDLGVTVRPLTSFGYKTAIRVTIGTREQNHKFVECLKKYLKGK